MNTKTNTITEENNTISRIIIIIENNEKKVRNILYQREMLQELLTLPEHLSSPRFLVGFVLLDL